MKNHKIYVAYRYHVRLLVEIFELSFREIVISLLIAVISTDKDIFPPSIP